jgi:hypothetical protein
LQLLWYDDSSRKGCGHNCQGRMLETSTTMKLFFHNQEFIRTFDI